MWLVLLAVALSVCGCLSEKHEEPADSLRIHVGDALPLFSAVTLTGDTVSSASFRGCVSVITFFSTKCGDCRLTLPELQKAYVSLEGQDVRFLCIARDEQADVVAPFWSDNTLTMPCSPQPDRRLYELFATSVVPRIFIADTSRTVRFLHDDTLLPDAETIVSEVKILLKTE